MEVPHFLKLHSYLEDYHNISALGNGSFGTVMLSKYRHSVTNLLLLQNNTLGTMLDPLIDSTYHLNGLVAIKTMKKTLSSLIEYDRVKEYQFIISVPSHPSLVQIYEMFIDSQEFRFHIVMESMNQNLYSFMKSRNHVRFLPMTLKCILRQIADGIRHIHRFGYFHRDIKPENILICATNSYYSSGGSGSSQVPNYRQFDNYVVKIADFGLARHVSNLNKYTAYVSTRWYRSPEILLRRNWYSKPVDIWAFGCVAVEIATFRPLFPGSNEMDQMWKVLEVLGCPTRQGSPGYTLAAALEMLHLPHLPLSGGSMDVQQRHLSLGGYWEEAEHLSAKLGFMLPPVDGIDIKQILPEENHTELSQIVRKCLTWNPDVRIDIEEICAMPYFQNTYLSKPYEEPARLYDNPYNLTINPKHLTDENTDPGWINNKVDQMNESKKENSRSVSFNVYEPEEDDFGSDKFELQFMKKLKYDDECFDEEKKENEREEEDMHGGDFVDELIEFPIRDATHIGADYSWATTTKYDTPLVLARGALFNSDNDESKNEDDKGLEEENNEDQEEEDDDEEEDEWAIVKSKIFNSISFDGIENRS